MTKIRIKTSKEYDVEIGEDASSAIAGFIRGNLARTRKVAVVTDSNVDALYSATVLSQLRDADLTAEKFTFPAGERSKTLSTYASLIDFLACRRFDRTDIILALGGGVAGDLAGFAAATYKRGIDFLQVPTTLLAMIDSSVGGKTGVDIASGKNLVGAFHQPSAVFCDLRFLETLPPEWKTDGMGEMVKYAILSGQPLFEALERNPLSMPGEREIAACVEIKRKIVEEDEKESGVRKLLNLGHSFGHAIELSSSYGISHGRAVATGLAMAARAGVKLLSLPPAECERIENLVASTGHDVHAGFSAAEIANAMLADKKVQGECIDIILPRRIGSCEAVGIPLSQTERLVEDAL